MTTTNEPTTRPRRALICGVGGQDGAYLASFLLGKGYEIVGTSRDAANAQHGGLKQLGIDANVQVEETVTQMCEAETQEHRT
jgi:GDPmannose 4,6-dehydratase